MVNYMQRKSIRKISDKRRVQLKEERILTAKLIIKQGGKCADCGGKLGWGSSPHHIIFRSHGGKSDIDNVVLLCLPCHGKRHHINLTVRDI